MDTGKEQKNLPLTSILCSAGYIPNEARDVLVNLEDAQIKLRNLVESLEKRVKCIEKAVIKEEPKHKKETRQCSQ